MQNVCSECGAQNEVGTEFCAFCHAFLAWDDQPAKASAGRAPAAQRGPSSPADQPLSTETRPNPALRATVSRTGAAEPGATPPADGTPRTAAGRFRAEIEQHTVDVAATGGPAVIDLRIANTSTIVDGYAVEAPGAPEWLRLEADQVQLLPGTDETVTLRLHVVSDTLVPAHRMPLTVRVTSLSQAPAYVDLALWVVVPALDVPVRAQVEPRVVRVIDRDSAECELTVDNTGSNRPVRVTFAGTDPELAVRFTFDPPELDVGPGATASARVTASAPRPEPGQQVSRSLTLSAIEGDHSVESYVTLHQSTTLEVEDPPVGLEVHPSLVRVEDGAPAMVRVIADNRRGAKWAHLHFKATDPEDVVDVMWVPSRIDIAPGETAQVEARLHAPAPAAGTEVSRSVTLRASDGLRISTGTATLVQVTSPSPMSTLELRVEPSIVRVHDVDAAGVEVVVDNQRGRSAAQVLLEGTDPECAVRFAFSSPRVEVAPGQVRAVAVRLDSPRPPPGQEVTRPFTITASDGHSDVDATGTLVQTASRDAVELLWVRLDPEVLRLAPWRRGRLTTKVDNSDGAHPVQVALTGDDPENALRFTFAPRVLSIPAGRVATSRTTVKVKPAPGSVEQTRPFTIMASDGRTEAKGGGELIQGAVDYRPMARVLLTVIGGLAMILGALRPWLSDGTSGIALGADDLALTFAGKALNLAGTSVSGAADVVPFVTTGLIAIALGVLVIFGLTGKTGGLTRRASLLGALLLIGLFVAFAVAGASVSPGSGAYLTLGGCVIGYLGGLLARR